LKDAPLGSFPIRLTASSTATGKTTTRTAEPFAGDKQVRGAFLTVLDSPAFTLELMTLSASIEQEQSAKLEVLAQRREGFAGEIKLSAEGFAAGKEPITKSFDTKEITVKAGDTLGQVSLKPKMDSEIGTRTVIIRGEATVDGQSVVQYSGPVPVTVVQLPFAVSSTLSRLSVTALPTNSASAAAEASTTIKVERRAGFTNELSLSLEGMPAGINTTLEAIPANGTETTLKLVATEKALAGTNTFRILAAGLHNDRTYKHRTAAITLVVSLPETMEPPAQPAATASATPVGGAAK
jgi:hypothetical protein